MFTVALIGADGAGKTTIARRLERAGALRIKYLYMGVNREAADHALFTTRLARGVRRLLGRPARQGGPPDPARRAARRRGGLRGAAASVKSNLRMVNQLAEEWYQQALSWWYRRRGYIVLCDRHFYCDFHAHDVAGGANLPLLRRVHGYMLDRVYPRPDLTIVLDAPAEVLYARKPEGTPQLLEMRRREYLDLAGQVAHAAVIDATQPQDSVASAVTAAIQDFGARRGGGPR